MNNISDVFNAYRSSFSVARDALDGGKFQEASTLFFSVLKEANKLFPPVSFEVADCLQGLGDSFYAENRFIESKSVYMQLENNNGVQKFIYVGDGIILPSDGFDDRYKFFDQVPESIVVSDTTPEFVRMLYVNEWVLVCFALALILSAFKLATLKMPDGAQLSTTSVKVNEMVVRGSYGGSLSWHFFSILVG